MTGTRIILYGGVNEIGGNKFLLEEDGRRLLLDFGTSIGARGQFYEEFLQPRAGSALRDLLRLGLLPDVDGIYREDLLSVARASTDRDLPESSAEVRRRTGRPGVDAVLLTHAHVDHFQDLSFVDPTIPVCCTPTTLRLLRAIQDCTGIDVQKEIVKARIRSVGSSTDKSTFGEIPKIVTEEVPREFRELEELQPTDVAGFEVTPVPVDHSVPGGCAYLVRTPRGRTVFYTGDVRFHGKLKDRTSALLKAVDGLEPDVMLCEGTRMGHDRGDDEDGVERGVAELVGETEGLAICEFAWKDTTRFDTIQKVAEATGRTLLVDPRTAYLVQKLDDRPDVPSRRIDSYGNVRVYLRRKDSMLGQVSDYEKHELGYDVDWGDRSKDMKRAWAEKDEAYLAERLVHWRDGVRAADVAGNPDKYLVHLTFWSSSELFDISPPKGSSWIRCATEPYNAEMTLDLRRQRNWLDAFELRHNVKGDGADAELLQGRTHVSGHGARPDLERLVGLAKPRLLVPVHTDEKHLDRFEDLGFATTSWRKVGWREAGKGRCVVEI